MSEQLTPTNAALMRENPLDEFRRRTGRDFTPSAVEIAMELTHLMMGVVMAEEYPHPNVPLEAEQAKLDLAIRALKQASIYRVKELRGDWIATA
jgi:hypothetical protein